MTSILPELKNYCYDIVFALILELFLFLVFLVKKFNYTDVYMEVFNELDFYMKDILKRCNFVVPKLAINEDRKGNDFNNKIPITFFQYINPNCNIVTHRENDVFINKVDRSTPLSKLKGLLALVSSYKENVEQSFDLTNTENQNDSNKNYQDNSKDNVSVSNNSTNLNVNTKAITKKVAFEEIKKSLLKPDYSIKYLVLTYLTYERLDLLNFSIVLFVNLNLLFMSSSIGYIHINSVVFFQYFINFVQLLLFFIFYFNHKCNKTNAHRKILIEDSNSIEGTANNKINYDNQSENSSFISMNKSNLIEANKENQNKIFFYKNHVEPILNWIYYDLWSSFIIDGEIYYCNLCFIFSLLSIIYPEWTGLLYSILLIGIIKYNDTANEILNAFSVRKDQIISMIGFLFLIINVYSSYGYYYMNEDYVVQTETDMLPINICSSLLSCEFAFFNYGVRSGGGIGDILKVEPYSSGKAYWFRLTADMIFYITITLLIIQMFSGIIIETFGSLRENSEIQNDDRQNSCFICSVRRVDFKKRNINFIEHKEKEHKLNDYIKVLLTYKLMKEEEANCLDFNDKYIWKCIKDTNYECFPINLICEKDTCVKIDNDE